jgi:hypothetical protein
MGHLGGIKPAEAFIGKEKPRLGRQRAGELELLQSSRAKADGRRLSIAGKADKLERLCRAPLRFEARDTGGAAIMSTFS